VDKNKKRKRSILLPLVIIGCIIGLIYIVVNDGFNEELRITNYTIKSDKVKEDIKIVQISDLHATGYGEKQSVLIDEIKQQEPDLIFITGDIMDEDSSIENVGYLLSGIKNLAPIYYVTGNHEYWDSKMDDLIRLLRQNNVIWLVDENRRIEVNGNIVNVSGLDDSEGYYYWGRSTTSEERLNNIQFNDKYLSLLLSHRPELAALYQESNFDIIFTGHAHGGQVRIPFILNGIIAPNQGFLPQYTKGIYELDNNTKMVVSTGLASNYIPRVFNNPELVVVTITRQ